jgi:hypothetical protein
MSKQKLALNVGLACILLGSLMTVPLRANAGKAPVAGVSSGGSTITGGSLAPRPTLTPRGAFSNYIPNVRGGNGAIISVLPGVTIQFNAATNSYILTASSQTLGRVIAAFNRLRNTGSNDNGQGSSVIVSILGGGQNRNEAANQLANRFQQNLEVDSTNVGELLSSLGNIFEVRTAAKLGVPVAELAPVRLVASIKGLAKESKDTIVAQNSEVTNVNLTALNSAIIAYNKIIIESSPVSLQKLSQDKDFLEIGTTLKELRNALVEAQ